MVRVTRQLAERIADLARLLLDDEGTDVPLQQLTDLAMPLIPGSAAVGVLAATDTPGFMRRHARTSPGCADLVAGRIDRQQFRPGGLCPDCGGERG